MSDNATRALEAAGSDANLPALPTGVPSTFKLKKRVTNQLLKMEEGAPYVVRFDGPIYQAQADAGTRRAPVDASAAAKPKMEPPKLALVTWYPDDPAVTGEDGVPRVIIIPTVLEGELLKAYPDDGYVGRYFVLVKTAIQGKRYKGFEIAELERQGGESAKEADPLPRSRKR